MQFQLSLFLYCYICCGVPLSRRKLLTLWHPWKGCSRASRYFVCYSYEECFCVLDCAYVGVPSWAQRAGRFQPTGPLEFQKRTRDVGHRLRKKRGRYFIQYRSSKKMTVFFSRYFPVFQKIEYRYLYLISVFLRIPAIRIPE